MYEKGKKYNIKYANTKGEVCETEITPDTDMNTPQLINKLKEDKKDFFKLLENKLIENSQEDKDFINKKENVKMERKEDKKFMDKISQIKKKTESKLQEEYDFFYGNKLQENLKVNSLEEYNKLSKKQKQELIKNYLQK